MRTKVKGRVRPADGPSRVVLYLRVSTAEQGDSGLGLAAQEAALRDAAQRRDWDVRALLSDVAVSGKTLDRPALTEALRLVTAGEADVLAVSKLDRLSRSILDFAGIMDRSQTEGWDVVALDTDVDTTTPSGRLVANLMASVAQWERDVISTRTREALAAKRAAGVRMGKPRSIPDEVACRIAQERAAGRSLRLIAEGLTNDRVPTAKGGPWSTSTVQRVLSRHELQEVN